jgi:ATP-binding cassette subfamily B (MDR/TAP) protein 1
MFTHLSPVRAKMDFGDKLEDMRPVSEARRSIYPPGSFNVPISTLEQHPDLQSPGSPISPPTPSPDAVRASFRGLFSLLPSRDMFTHLIPAILVTVAASLIQPYMSIVIGEMFQISEAYPLNTRSATPIDKTNLMTGVNKSCLKLTIAGGVAALLNYFRVVLWQRHGEALVARLREAVYAGIQNKPMEWFDLGMGMTEGDGDDNEKVGAGGLMAKFTR